MAIDIFTPQSTATDRPGLCTRNLERIARAVYGGRTRTATAIAGSTGGLLSTEAGVVLLPTDSPDVLAMTCVMSETGDAEHDLWHLGPAAPRLFERSCHTADGWREPWSGLRMRLGGLGVRSWAAVPLGTEGRTAPLGLLVVGNSDEGRPCGRMDRLPDLALTAAAALAAAPEDEMPMGGSSRPPQHERLQMVSNLSFGVSHTLGNIFGAILGNLQFLQETISDDEARELLESAERSTSQGVELMQSLQHYAASPATAGMEALDLSDLVDDVAGLVKLLIGHWPNHRDVHIDTDIADAAPVWGNASQLRECIVNLIFNAVQAVGREGHILVRASHDGRCSEVRVIDDGSGMTDEVRRRATEPFFTTEPTLREGLGLTVARGIAVAHRGSVTLHHARVNGTEVAIRLPEDPPADARRETAFGVAPPATSGH